MMSGATEQNSSLKAAEKLAGRRTETSFAVRPRTRLSFACFSLEDAPKEVPSEYKERKVGAAPGRGNANRPTCKQVQ
jgi:hypothetical protein